MGEVPVKDVILKSAGDLFHKRGYSSVTVDEVITVSGVSRADYHRAFPSKSALGQAWLNRLSKGMRYIQEGVLKHPGEKKLCLRRYCFSMRNWMETNNYRSCQFANTAACIDADEEQDLIELIDQYKREQRKFFITMVGLILSEEEDAKRIGTTVYLLFSGAMTEAQNLKASWPLDDAVKAAERLCGIDLK